MKKIILLSLIAFTGTAIAQADSDRKLNAGICIATGLNLNKTGTKRMETNGVGGAFTIGLVGNYNISSTIAFATGLEIDFESNKVKPSAANGNSYYYFSDTKIELNKDSKPTQTLYNWTERKQKPVYLTIPTMLAFRTKYFGDFRYTAKFGLRTSVMLGNKINDKGFTFDDNTTTGVPTAVENTTMRASKDMNFIRSSAGLALGTEWNFSGPTSLCAEIGYYYGFTPIYFDNKVENTTLFTEVAGVRDYYSNRMTQSQIQLKISVLF
jgi:hypothetical protein